MTGPGRTRWANEIARRDNTGVGLDRAVAIEPDAVLDDLVAMQKLPPTQDLERVVEALRRASNDGDRVTEAEERLSLGRRRDAALSSRPEGCRCFGAGGIGGSKYHGIWRFGQWCSCADGQ